MTEPEGHICPRCQKCLRDAGGLYQHVKAKHGRKAARPFYVPPDREPSLADELVAAEIAFKTEGVRPPAWLRAMFPDSFKRGHHA